VRLAFSPDGRHLAALANNSVWLLRLTELPPPPAFDKAAAP
jgi:hypothetical protein